MTARRLRPTLLAALAAALLMAGCGSTSSASKAVSSAVSSVSSTASSAASSVSSGAKSAASSATSAVKSEANKAVGKQYKAGETCTTKNESSYKAHGYTCENGHLKKS